jgi:hypothetical protein
MTDAVRARSTGEIMVRGLGVASGWHALLVAAYVLWAFLQPSEHSGSGCDGIGWGCTPNPRDGALIVGVVFGIPIVGTALLVSGVVTAALAFRLRSGKAAGTAGTVTAWLLVGVLFVWYQTLR